MGEVAWRPSPDLNYPRRAGEEVVERLGEPDGSQIGAECAFALPALEKLPDLGVDLRPGLLRLIGIEILTLGVSGGEATALSLPDVGGVARSKKRSSSTGKGRTRVEFFSAATSTTVSNSRSCSAAGW